MMTRDEMIRLPYGTLLVTPFEPRGVVKLLVVDIETALVEFTHDHSGHKAGTAGRYFIRELITVEQAEQICRDGSGLVSHDVMGERCARCGKEIL